jgi:hypothetical protein
VLTYKTPEWKTMINCTVYFNNFIKVFSLFYIQLDSSLIMARKGRNM